MTKHISSLNINILKVLENELRYVDKNNTAVVEWLYMRIASIKGE
jgi:hypothetical protein